MKTRTEDHIIAWGFLTPALVVMVAFGLFPIGYAFFVSLHSWRIKKDAFVGFEHYGKALGEGQYLLWFIIGLFLLWSVSRLRSALSFHHAASHSISALLYVPVLWILLSLGLDGMLNTGDERLYNGFKVTFFYAVGTIPIQLSIL